MQKANISRATLGRLPEYLQYIRDCVREETVSAASIARGLSLGEVQVRKDLNSICDAGRPKIGFPTDALILALEEVLCSGERPNAVIIGAGKLGTALYDFDGFSTYGIRIIAAFDKDPARCSGSDGEHPVLPVAQLADFCRENHVRAGILTLPASAAQEVCDTLTDSGVTSIWNFAPCRLTVPRGVTVKNENLALSLAHLYVAEI